MTDPDLDRTRLEVQRLNIEAQKVEAEARKLFAEQMKLEAERGKQRAEELEMERRTAWHPLAIGAGVTLAVITLLGTLVAVLIKLVGAG